MYDIIDEVNELIESKLNTEDFEKGLRSTKWNLDERARPSQFWYNTDCLVVKGSTRMLDYYGGFEYVDDEYKKTLGDYTFYSTEHSRVSSLVDRMYGVDEEEEDEEEVDG